MYVTPEMYDQPDAISFQYGWIMGVDSGNAAKTATGTAEGVKLDNAED